MDCSRDAAVLVVRSRKVRAGMEKPPWLCMCDSLGEDDDSCNVSYSLESICEFDLPSPRLAQTVVSVSFSATPLFQVGLRFATKQNNSQLFRLHRAILVPSLDSCSSIDHAAQSRKIPLMGPCWTRQLHMSLMVSLRLTPTPRVTSPYIQ